MKKVCFNSAEVSQSRPRLLPSALNFRHTVPNDPNNLATPHPLDHSTTPRGQDAGMLMRNPVAIATGGRCFGTKGRQQLMLSEDWGCCDGLPLG